MIRDRFTRLCFLVAATSLSRAQAAPQAPNSPQIVVATINATQVREPISRYDYGMFIEHLGNIINHGLWSEMLDDRKFYYPVNSAEEKEPDSNPMRARFLKLRKWRPIGPDEFVVMDHEHAYVGVQSPEIKLESKVPHGIQQSGLALRKGKTYSGRIVLAGSPQARVTIGLVWGTGASDHQTIAIRGLHSDYGKFTLSFTARADSDQGRVEITGTGSGSFHVGVARTLRSLRPGSDGRSFRHVAHPKSPERLQQVLRRMVRAGSA